MNRGERIDGLELNDKDTLDEEIDLSLANSLAFVKNFDFLFSFEGDVSGDQFQFHGFLVDRLQVTGPEMAVHFDRSSDHRPVRDVVFIVRLLPRTSNSFMAHDNDSH